MDLLLYSVEHLKKTDTTEIDGKPMAILIQRLKERVKELEGKHRGVPLVVLETELRRRPITMRLPNAVSKEIDRVFKEPYLRGEIVEDNFAVKNLPRILFDSATFTKIEKVAYDQFAIDEIRDVPRIPYYTPEHAGIRGGLELVRKGVDVATLFESEVYINRDYELAEELADALVKSVYGVEAKPSLLTMLFARVAKVIRKMLRHSST
ncbi:MAG: hypothetical protein AOA65_2395 [Candidatus Bathyarchaeota archaeon BA1]|nr:MAG: hypothetical protein AOA65_2395 [Candidatus Bathyarchaeota archaeon BA1]